MIFSENRGTLFGIMLCARAAIRAGKNVYNDRLTASGVMWRGPGAARLPAAV
jgi:hypothetical protein